ncbi:hypothetical protein CH63R_10297 [Colletotrichum higginsianum IMI 349063]|uniref:Uncharacterized protein n=1 Tax=Colletotrichum higginsianum (strain IMI 349063) TaxID=759273 RepID=A0A1B7Y2E4_COLHI|nr:uncharacterized protein CH63R_10297 [Colletotrichum higginsianum IMI 349063]OBR06177.1 hypothetical protein CH63R_10297 [Colletotrichum higginsianum IMI 349063]
MEPKPNAPLDMAMSDPISLSLSLSLLSLWTDSGLGIRADADAGYGFCPCHTTPHIPAVYSGPRSRAADEIPGQWQQLHDATPRLSELAAYPGTHPRDTSPN